MSKIVEQAKRMLEENGVNPEMLDRTIEYTKRITALESEICVTVENTARYIKELEQEKENLEEEISYLAQEAEDLREAGLRLVVTDIEFLDKFINIDINSKDELKELQELASRRITILKDIEIYSR